MRLVSAAAVLISVVVVGLVGTAGAAHAATGNYDILINTTRADFGLFIDPLSQEPMLPGGILYWQASGNNYLPRLVGVLSTKNASGYCARVRLDALNASGNSIASAYLSSCPPSNSWRITGVDLTTQPVIKSNLDRMKVSIWLQAPGGAYLEQASVYVYP
jgi:hypothetical protein